MTGLSTDRLADLIGRVREIVDDEWQKQPVERPHVLLPGTAVIAVLFGLRYTDVLVNNASCNLPSKFVRAQKKRGLYTIKYGNGQVYVGK